MMRAKSRLGTPGMAGMSTPVGLTPNFASMTPEQIQAGCCNALKIFRGMQGNYEYMIWYSGIADWSSCSIATYQSLKWQAYRYDAEINERNAPMTDEDMSVTRVGCLAAESLFRKPLFHYFPDSEVEKDQLGCAHAATVTTGGFHKHLLATAQSGQLISHGR